MEGGKTIEISTFLDSSERCNSKTFYYLRVCARHKIPLVVHGYDYSRRLLSDYFNDIGNYNPVIFSIHNEDMLRRYRYKRMIADNDFVKTHEDYGYFKWLSDDDIRDIILTDMAEGNEHFYE